MADDWMTRSLSRAEYRTECTIAGVRELVDLTCASILRDPPEGLFRGGLDGSVEPGSYALSNPSWALGMLIARARGRGIEAERSATPTIQPPAETIRCSACGRQVSRALAMRASRGTVCPDCYERASD